MNIFFVYSNSRYTWCRIGMIVLALLCVYIFGAGALDYPEIKWVFIAHIFLCLIVIGYIELMWGTYILVSDRGIYRIVPLLFYKKIFIPWEELTISGVITNGDSYLYDFDFIYLSSAAQEVHELIEKRDFWRFLRGNVSTIFFSPSKKSLSIIKEHISEYQYQRIITRLEQPGRKI